MTCMQWNLNFYFNIHDNCPILNTVLLISRLIFVVHVQHSVLVASFWSFLSCLYAFVQFCCQLTYNLSRLIKALGEEGGRSTFLIVSYGGLVCFGFWQVVILRICVYLFMFVLYIIAVCIIHDCNLSCTIYSGAWFRLFILGPSLGRWLCSIRLPLSWLGICIRTLDRKDWSNVYSLTGGWVV